MSEPQLADVDIPGGPNVAAQSPRGVKGASVWPGTWPGMGSQSSGEPSVCRGPGEEGSLARVSTPMQGEKRGEPGMGRHSRSREAEAETGKCLGWSSRVKDGERSVKDGVR